MIRFVNSDYSRAGLVDVESLPPKKRLRIGKVPWHTGHDYELTKLPADFLVAGDTHRRWALSQRPVPGNVTFVTSGALTQADLLILHVDQWILQEIDKLSVFRRCLKLDRPKVVINHGCNTVDGCSSSQMGELLDGQFVVCNSATAHAAWKLPNSVYIRHGMSPEEWPQTNYGRQNIVVTQPYSKIHERYRNNEAVSRFENTMKIKVDWVGRDHRFDTFDKYRAFLGKSSVYFNPSFASPNPRARTEAMLCGLVPVTTNAHGENEYIQNGVNGYCSNNMDELYHYLALLQKDPDRCRTMGAAARATAQDVFHISKFVARWHDVIARMGVA